MRIILVGFMGSGKTSFGKKLAKKLNIPFIDSDHEIELQEKKSINELFEMIGESGFREIEQNFILNLKQKSDSFILSTGGGLPCYKNNMEQLNSIGTTIYLELTPKALQSRLKSGKDHRPLLKNKTDDEMLLYIEEKLNERIQYYNQAQIKIDGLHINAKVIQNLTNKIYSK